MRHADKQISHHTVTPRVEKPATSRKMSNLTPNLSTTKKMVIYIYFLVVQIESKKNQGAVNMKCFYAAIRFRTMLER